jgi:tetratricopeptide (TPR) repeat protein
VEEIKLTDKAFKLYLDKNYSEAINLLELLLEDNIECAKCYRILAYIYDAKNKFNLAEKNHILAIKYSLNDAGFYLARASFYFKNNLFMDAIDDYSYIINNDNVLYRDISLDTAYFERSLAYCCLGKFNKVLDDFNKYELHMNFTYMKPISCKINKKILFEYATKKEKFPTKL